LKRRPFAALLAVALVPFLWVAPRVEAAGIPGIGVGDVSISEGTASVRLAKFSVTLDRPSATTVTLQYRIVAQSATAGADVDTANGQVRTLTFRAGAVAKSISVKILPDSVDEPDETFAVVLSNPTNATLVRPSGLGTIRDDDPIGNGFLATVDDVSVVEGDERSRTLSFTVALSQRAPNSVSVEYLVEPLSATAGADVIVPAVPKLLTFKKGTSGFTPVAKTVVVTVLPDLVSEGDETFALRLQNPSVGMLLSDATGIGRIIDDEVPTQLLMGTAVSWPTLGQQAQYAAIAGQRFDILTPENEMKWDATEPQRGIFQFGAADAIVDFAVAHGQSVHGHALAWHWQNPAWLTNGGFGRAELIAILTNHVTTVMQHFDGKVSVWDVVNEPIGDDTQLRQTVWSQGIGSDYLDIAFHAARAADPDVELYVNEYNIEFSGPKADALYALVSGMVARGVPIDGVGFQVHTYLGGVTTAGLSNEFARYAALGLDVAVTELDVRLALPTTPASLESQAMTYVAVRDACVAAPNCSSFTTWGFTDAYSWIPAFFPGYGAALPWDAAYQPKPAYDVIEPLLRN
jgi:endo-1,4-beta-xylanase